MPHSSREAVRAILAGNIEEFDRLVEAGLDPLLVVEPDEWSFLHRALISVVHRPDTDMIGHLLDLGIDVNGRDRYGNTPLHLAAQAKNVAVMELLLEAGADLDAMNDRGITPLRSTLMRKPFDVAATELLLERGANPDMVVEGSLSIRDYVGMIAHGDDAFLRDLFDCYPPASTS